MAEVFQEDELALLYEAGPSVGRGQIRRWDLGEGLAALGPAGLPVGDPSLKACVGERRGEGEGREGEWLSLPDEHQRVYVYGFWTPPPSP